jgi:1-aminocyclopropane-1-carboxylate deaminase/D-cysteine desulfhydrase-like pyridoxal-dependent ACC family enzyme
MTPDILSTGNIPVIEVQDKLFHEREIKLFVKRDDLIHPQISGNKWRKLKYNIGEMIRQGKNVMLTFGGAYSNHILATAAAGKEFGFETIGVIRGEAPQERNERLKFAERTGMKLHYISREKFRTISSPEFLDEMMKIFGDFYIVPQGGANELGVEGCSEIVSEISMDFTHICCATGTGATLAGIASSLPSGKTAIGFCVHKGFESVKEDIVKWTRAKNNFMLITDYHFGGFAKRNSELGKFTETFSHEKQIPVEPVYTGKMFYGIYDLIKKDFFPPGSVIFALHTGGIF